MLYRKDEHQVRYAPVGQYAVHWEYSNFPDRGEYYGFITLNNVTAFEGFFLPDVLTLKCWVLEKMEEYDAKAPRTSVGVS